MEMYEKYCVSHSTVSISNNEHSNPNFHLNKLLEVTNTVCRSVCGLRFYPVSICTVTLYV